MLLSAVLLVFCSVAITGSKANTEDIFNQVCAVLHFIRLPGRSRICSYLTANFGNILT